MVYFSYSVVTVLLLFWLATCFFVAILWMLKRLGRALGRCGGARAKGVMLFGAIALSATISGLASSCFAQAAIPTPTETPAEDVNSAYINSVNQYSEALKLYADSISPNARAGSPTPMPTPDLWGMPAFQTAMSTLWQAPLTILAIVLAIAALVGYQGYLDIRDKLEKQVLERHNEFQERFSAEQKQLMSRVENQATFSIAIGQLDATWRSWTLALDLVKEYKRRKQGDKRTEQDIEDAIESELPPASFNEANGALPHLRFAKSLCNRALFYFRQVPKELRSASELPKDFYELEAGQAYAYYVATDYEKSTEGEWKKALRYTEQARAALKGGSLNEVPESELAGMNEDWLDSYLYVRVLYLLTEHDADSWELAKAEFWRAYEAYQDASPRTKKRFSPQLGNPYNFLRDREKLRSAAVPGPRS